MRHPMELDLIEQARKAGQAYVDAFQGDLDAMSDDLNQRAAREGRTVAQLAPKSPHPWQLPARLVTSHEKNVESGSSNRTPLD